MQLYCNELLYPTDEAEDWAAFDENTAANTEYAEPNMASNPEAEEQVPVSTEGLRQVYVLYNFDSQNSDELTISENEMVFISEEECDEEGWVVCINAQGQKGKERYFPILI